MEKEIVKDIKEEWACQEMIVFPRNEERSVCPVPGRERGGEAAKPQSLGPISATPPL